MGDFGVKMHFIGVKMHFIGIICPCLSLQKTACHAHVPHTNTTNTTHTIEARLTLHPAFSTTPARLSSRPLSNEPASDFD